MLKTALAYKNVFPRLKLFESPYVLVPSEAKWKTAKDVCNRLELFYNVTELFFGTRYPTANMFFPVISRIKLTLNEWLMSSNVVISTMEKSMVTKFDAYWNVIHKLMGVAAVLDPRYKMTLLHFYFPLVYQMTLVNKLETLNDFVMSWWWNIILECIKRLIQNLQYMERSLPLQKGVQ